MATRAAALVAIAIAVATTPAAPGAPRITPDQKLVAGLEAASSASREAVRHLRRSAPADAEAARDDLRRSVEALDAVARVGANAVGALQTPSVHSALTSSRILTDRAAADVSRAHYGDARTKLERALSLQTAALRDFGVPLEKEFASFAVRRRFHPLTGFQNYSGVSVKSGAPVSEVIIGAADRATANAGERPRSSFSMGSRGLPITALSVYVLSDPIGRFISDWCSLDAGIITCRLRRAAMQPENVFTIAFGPKLAGGTRLLVKLRGTDGARSYALLTTR